MKNKNPFLPYLRMAGFALIIMSCTGTAANAGQKLKVVVSIAPIHALAAGIMEGIGEPELLIPGGASPHSYSLKPSEARALYNARIVVRVSDQLESFLVRPLETLAGDAEVLTLTRIKGMIIYKSRDGGLWEGVAARSGDEQKDGDHVPVLLQIDIHALDYDHETARAKMIEAKVCREYAQALCTGLWPSLDVLPEAAKKQTGTPIDLSVPVFVESIEPVSIQA